MLKGSLGEAERGRQKGRREAKVGQAPRWVPTQGSGKRAPRKCRVGVSWSSRTERGRGKSNAAGRPKAAGGGGGQRAQAAFEHLEVLAESQRCGAGTGSATDKGIILVDRRSAWPSAWPR